MSMKPILIATLISLGLSSSAIAQEKRVKEPKLKGSIYVFGNIVKTPRVNQPCQPLNYEGYSDLVFGTTLVVRNGKGNVIATKEIPQGTQQYYADYDDVMVCEVTIPEIKLPKAEFYSFTFGDRKELTYSKEQLKKQNWNLDLTIGIN